MKRFASLALLLLAGVAAAQETPLGSPVPDKTPRDVEFGVTTRQFGLERRVEMYQWRATGTSYEKTWSSEPIASASFAPGHDNPGVFPLASRRILVDRITIDDHPLDPAAVASLGVWRDFRPNFSALPGNLSATFQPEGDGLGSAENPLDPQVGDLRVTWRELMLPPLDGKVALQGGVWTLQPSPDTQPVLSRSHAPGASISKGTLGWLIGAGAFVLLILLIRTLMRKRRR